MKKYINGRIIEITSKELAEVQAERETYENSDEYKQERIAELKQMLADTDYIACKIAEGVALREEYSDELAQRQSWRKEINLLESETTR